MSLYHFNHLLFLLFSPTFTFTFTSFYITNEAEFLMPSFVEELSAKEKKTFSSSSFAGVRKAQMMMMKKLHRIISKTNDKHRTGGTDYNGTQLCNCLCFIFCSCCCAFSGIINRFIVILFRLLMQLNMFRVLVSITSLINFSTHTVLV